jgi:hypothetical protein
MVDNTNPTSQFHPYQPETSTPQADVPVGSTTGLGGMLGKLGLNRSALDAITGSMSNANMRGGLNKARGMAQNNGGLVLGGLAALAIGAGLLRKRGMTR